MKRKKGDLSEFNNVQLIPMHPAAACLQCTTRDRLGHYQSIIPL